jgi:hypothetical protein
VSLIVAETRRPPTVNKQIYIHRNDIWIIINVCRLDQVRCMPI